MAYIDFIGAHHRSTKRDYLTRVMERDKAECVETSGRWGQQYWDGPRHFGYGGYHYDGRWRSVAESMVKHYALPTDVRILDVGCGKGFLLYEFIQLLPSASVHGIAISTYGAGECQTGGPFSAPVCHADNLPFESGSFYSTREWDWVFAQTEYTGDHSFNYFE